MRRNTRWLWILLFALAPAAAYAGGGQGSSEGGSGPTIRDQGGEDKPGKAGGEADKGPGKADKGSGEAEKEGEDKGEEQRRGRPGGLFGGSSIFLIMIGVLVLMFILTSRGRRKQQAKRRDMLASLKKGDKVTTIGGVVGTIMDVREDEVTVKVDETNNIRVHFARWAVRGVGETAKKEQR